MIFEEGDSTFQINENHANVLIVRRGTVPIRNSIAQYDIQLSAHLNQSITSTSHNSFQSFKHTETYTTAIDEVAMSVIRDNRRAK